MLILSYDLWLLKYLRRKYKRYCLQYPKLQCFIQRFLKFA